jgi:hypothetical protein
MVVRRPRRGSLILLGSGAITASSPYRFMTIFMTTFVSRFFLLFHFGSEICASPLPGSDVEL